MLKASPQTKIWPDRFVNTREMKQIIGVSKSTIDRYEKADPTFPRRIPLSLSKVVWRLSEVEAWMDHKAAEREAVDS